MIPPAVNLYERPAAQNCAPAVCDLSRAANPANVTLSANVPSCFYPADTHKTCYPSPIRRSAVQPARPPFFAQMALRETSASSNVCRGVRSGARGNSTGDAEKCAPNSSSPRCSRARLPFLDASHPILNAQASAPSRAGSRPRPLAVALRPAFWQAPPLARFATKSQTSAASTVAGQPRAHTLNSDHRSLSAAVVFFVTPPRGALTRTRAAKTRLEGTPTCSRNC